MLRCAERLRRAIGGEAMPEAPGAPQGLSRAMAAGEAMDRYGGRAFDTRSLYQKPGSR